MAIFCSLNFIDFDVGSEQMDDESEEVNN